MERLSCTTGTRDPSAVWVGVSCLLSRALMPLSAVCVLSAVQHTAVTAAAAAKILQDKGNNKRFLHQRFPLFSLSFPFAATWKERSRGTAKAEENKAKRTQMVSPQI